MCVLYLCFFYVLQKKERLALVEQEREKARVEAFFQQKLREEKERIRKLQLEESKKVCCVKKKITESPFTPFF